MGGGGGGESGGASPQKILNFKCSEIASSAIRKLTLHVRMTLTGIWKKRKYIYFKTIFFWDLQGGADAP